MDRRVAVAQTCHRELICKLRRRKTVRGHPIVVTEFDARRLRGLVGARSDASLRDQAHLRELKSELERALVVDAAHVPADVITMDTRVQLLDLSSGERKEYVLVHPADSDVSANRISVLAPLGTALLGYRVGDEVEWEMPGGLRRLRIERAIQPADEQAARAGAGEAPITVVPAGAH
jgi:regulator of nucleoside diphosphate kinase